MQAVSRCQTQQSPLNGDFPERGLRVYGVQFATHETLRAYCVRNAATSATHPQYPIVYHNTHLIPTPHCFRCRYCEFMPSTGLRPSTDSPSVRLQRIAELPPSRGRAARHRERARHPTWSPACRGQDQQWPGASKRRPISRHDLDWAKMVRPMPRAVPPASLRVSGWRGGGNKRTAGTGAPRPSQSHHAPDVVAPPGPMVPRVVTDTVQDAAAQLGRRALGRNPGWRPGPKCGQSP